MSPPVVLAVDGNSLVHRSYHAQAQSGQAAWAVRGLLTQLVAAVERIRPVAVVVGFDDPCRSARREQWPSYKANRSEKLETLVEQLAAAAVVLRQLGVAVVVPDGLEADDVLASAAAFAPGAGARTVIVTSDRDAFALIGEHTRALESSRRRYSTGSSRSSLSVTSITLFHEPAELGIQAKSAPYECMPGGS